VRPRERGTTRRRFPLITAKFSLQALQTAPSLPFGFPCDSSCITKSCVWGATRPHTRSFVPYPPPPPGQHKGPLCCGHSTYCYDRTTPDSDAHCSAPYSSRLRVCVRVHVGMEGVDSSLAFVVCSALHCSQSHVGLVNVYTSIYMPVKTCRVWGKLKNAPAS